MIPAKLQTPENPQEHFAFTNLVNAEHSW